MAKKDTNKAPAAQAAASNAQPPAEGTKPAAPAKPKTVDTFFHKNNPAEGAKLAPQARCIVNVLAGFGEKGATRETLVEALKGKLTTRQPEGRILTYYQKTLVEAGYISIETAPAA